MKFWLKWLNWLFGGGAVVAILLVLVPYLVSVIKHKQPSPETVSMNISYTANRVEVYIRNNSNEPLDLVKAEIFLSSDDILGEGFGIYKEATHVYRVTSQDGSTKLVHREGTLAITLDIFQAIAPGDSDRFAVEVDSIFDNAIPPDTEISVSLYDPKGSEYSKKLVNAE